MLSNVELISRPVLAAALGSVIGFERERLSWAAGNRAGIQEAGSGLRTRASVAQARKHATMRPRKPMQPLFRCEAPSRNASSGVCLAARRRVWPRCQSSTYARFRCKSRSPIR
jgi:hypothetical protein